MAENSKREQIVVSNYNLVNALSGIKSVIRTMPEFSELQSFAQTQFPVCAVVGRLPVPEEKISNRRVSVDQIISEIKVDIFTYIQTNKNLDEQISDVADDLFAQLYTDESRGGLVFETLVKINEKVNVWNPFAAFQITAVHKYAHSKGGI